MANLALNDVYEVKFYCTFGVQTATPRFHVRITNIVGTPTDVHLADRMDTAFALHLKNIMTDQASYRGVSVQRLFPLPKTAPVFDITGQGPGANAGTPLPKQVSGLIAKKTNFAARNMRGRFYIPFPSETDSDPTEARPNAAYVTLAGFIATGLSNFHAVGAGGNTADAVPIIYSGTGAHVNGSDIVQCLTRGYWATQRRRGDFGAANLSPI